MAENVKDVEKTNDEVVKDTGNDNVTDKSVIDDNKNISKTEESTKEDFEKKENVTKDNNDKEKSSKMKKSKKKDKKDEKIEELQDRLVRNMAEFDNFRKRTDKEKSQMFEIGAKSVIEKILPVVDNFERALDAASEEEKETPFVQGIDKIYKHMMTTFEEIGVTPIDAVGKEFDPNLHNAVMHDEDEEMGENIISEQFQKGYMYKDSVLRHSMVKVVN